MLRLQMGSPHPAFTSCFSKWEEGVLACSSAVTVPAFEPWVQPPVAHKARYGGNHRQSQELRRWSQENQELIHANLGYLKSSSPAWAAWMRPYFKKQNKTNKWLWCLLYVIFISFPHLAIWLFLPNTRSFDFHQEKRFCFLKYTNRADPLRLAKTPRSCQLGLKV